MRIVWYVSELQACGHIRGEYIAREIHRQYGNIHISCKETMMQSDVTHTDLMVFQRSCMPDMFTRMRYAQSLGVKCVYDQDDDMLNLPPGLGKLSETFCRPELRDAMRSFMQYADAITVTTKTLAMAMTPYTRAPIYVIQNYIDADQWEIWEATRRTTKRDDVTIGWTTSPAHVLDGPVIGETIKKLLDEFSPNLRFNIYGPVDKACLGEWAKDEKYKMLIGNVPWVNVQAIPQIWKDMDIGIAPLLPTQFNKCRSNIKWQQHGLLGQPCVMAKLPPYENVRHGETGFLAETPEDWYTHLKALVVDKDLRVAIGNKARLEVLTHWDLRRKVSSWVDTFRKIVDKDRR